MATALVTGSAGFVGRHFAAHLRGQGWTVHGVDVRSADLGTYVIDARDVFRNWTDQHYDLVIHAAAVVGGRETIDNNPLAQAVNLELDAGLFQWAMRARPGRIVYFSSSAAYPVARQTHALRHRMWECDLAGSTDPVGMPDQLYGWCKVTGELLARRALDQGQAVTVVRPFSGYGEDQDATYPFPAFVDRALARADPFLIWGDGRQVRDFIHIDDIVTTAMVVVDRDANGPVNLATGRPTSMYSLAQQVCDQAGYSPMFEYSKSAPSGVEYRVADPAKMWGFCRPQVSLEEGIARALKYRKQYQQYG